MVISWYLSICAGKQRLHEPGTHAYFASQVGNTPRWCQIRTLDNALTLSELCEYEGKLHLITGKVLLGMSTCLKIFAVTIGFSFEFLLACELPR